MAYTEFFCRLNGSNLNGGHLNSNAEPGTGAVYTSTNGNWDGTSLFIPTDASTPASTVTVGDFASVYLDGATVGVYIARVTNVAAGVNGTITLSTTAFSGTAPTVGVTGRTIKVGGAWKGPNAAENFPFGFITNAAVSAASVYPRVNFKNDTTYAITAAMTHANNGPTVFQGYTSTAGDLGRATIDGTIVGASYTMLTLSGTQCRIVDLIWANNGTTGAAIAVTISGAGTTALRCVIHDVRGEGLRLSASNAIECEAYICNSSNTTSIGAFVLNDRVAQCIRCIAHDNAGNLNNGFLIAGGGSLICCIADTNGQHGIFTGASTSPMNIINCDSYNNAGSGIAIGQSTTNMCVDIENCNLVKNTLFGINFVSTGAHTGYIFNCGFGSGSQANGSGTTNNLISVEEVGSVTYASGVTPWVAPTTGNFSINLPAAINAGRGAFTETQASYTGTVGFPVIGAAQTMVSALFAGLLRLLGVGRF